MKDLEKQNEELTFLLYMSLFAFLIVTVIAIVFISKSKQYEKDIIMIVKDVADRQRIIDKKNHELNAVKDDMFWLRHVNGELIEKCDPSTVNKVIKKTPLPKMKALNVSHS